MRIESAARGETEIAAGSNVDTLRVGKYSYQSLKQTQKHKAHVIKPPDRPSPKQSWNTHPERREPFKECFNCGNRFTGNPTNHLTSCPAKYTTCSSCGRSGHFAKFCRRNRAVNQAEETNSEDEILSINIFKIDSTHPVTYQHPGSMYRKPDFKVQVIVNNSLASVIADTGAKVSVCGSKEAKSWGLLEKMQSSKIKIKPYNSEPIKVRGASRCAVTFGTRSIPVIWYIVDGLCEPILGGNSAVQLGIVQFNKQPDVLMPVHMIDSRCQVSIKNEIQNILANYKGNFKTEGFGKLKDYQVKFHEDKTIKPIVTPPRPTAYHLEERVNEEIQKMIKYDVIEEHPRTEPAPWVSASVIKAKDDGGLRVTLDARNVNRAIISNNLPIPRQEDIKAKISGATIFSKLDLHSAFWQMEFSPESRHLTVFSCGGKLYRYKRLTMGIKTAQGELNAALVPLFSHIPEAHVIHDDLIIASKQATDHIKTIKKVMEM